MSKTIKLSFLAAIAVTSLFAAKPYANTKAEVIDKRFYTAGAMFAYTEFELSGEPLAETLGLDLDTLDPNAINKPTEFDYTAGVESYEYSEEAMYALNYQSKMGPHLANGILNSKRGGNMESLAKRFTELSKATGNDVQIIPLNIYPIALPYISGNPEFGQKVDMTIVNYDEIKVIKNAKESVVKTATPAYLRDYKTLSWIDADMDKTLNPAALGGAMLKDIMWAQDFLGGMHTIDGDKEVEATSSRMDADGKYALGVSGKDGINGAILTELAWERALYLQERLGFDGKNLGVKFDPSYDASKPVWFANKMSVQEGSKNGVKSIDSIKVLEPHSSLRDTWQLLWPMSEFYAFSDQRVVNKSQKPAFLAVFDGKPFKNAPKVNIDADPKNDVSSDDPFSLANNISNLLFENISKLHFNNGAGTFIDTFDGSRQSDIVTIFDAAYSIEALRIYQRAVDALPVGYASSDKARSLNSQKGKMALELIKKEADFLISKIKNDKGLYATTYNLKSNAKEGLDIGTQFAVVRGLGAAYLATKDEKYRKEARNLMLAIEKNMYDAKLGTYVDASKEYTPYTIGAVSGGLRTAIKHLKNDSFEKESALELKNLIDRFTRWFQLVVNGNSTKDGAQLAEWLLDTGEYELADGSSSNNDGDNVAPIHAAGGKYGTAAVMAGKVKLSN